MSHPSALAAPPPLTARSVALSLLLGVRPARLPVRDLTRLGSLFGIAPSAMRAALSRMVAAGDLTAQGSTYALTARHLRRQARLERMLQPRLQPFDGTWSMLVVVVRGRTAQARSTLREELATHRFAELREGVWLHPANLDDPPVAAGSQIQTFRTVPERPHALCRTLWDLDGWAAQAQALLAVLDRPGQSLERFTAAAAAVRHLQTDPALPDSLVPHPWPGDDLRRCYQAYRAELTDLITTEAP